MAALIARTFDAEVVALHLARVPSPHSLSGIPKMVETLVPEEDEIQRFLANDFGGLKIKPVVETGSPWARIIDTARVEKADIIVMSTHGHDSIADQVVGSHTERVIHRSPCPVLVV